MRPFKPIARPVPRSWYEVDVTFTHLEPCAAYDAEADRVVSGFERSEPTRRTLRVRAASATPAMLKSEIEGEAGRQLKSEFRQPEFTIQAIGRLDRSPKKKKRGVW